MGLESGKRSQEAGWMIARVAQKDTQPVIIHLAWLAYRDGNMLGISLRHAKKCAECLLFKCCKNCFLVRFNY